MTGSRWRLQRLHQPDQQIIVDLNVGAAEGRRKFGSHTVSIRDISELHIKLLRRAVIRVQTHTEANLRAAARSGQIFQCRYKPAAYSLTAVLLGDDQILYLRDTELTEALVGCRPKQRAVGKNA